MDSDMRRVQVSIYGKLPERYVQTYEGGGGKARCVTCESFARGVGMQKTTDWIMEYDTDQGSDEEGLRGNPHG